MRVNPAVKVSYTFAFSFLPLIILALFDRPGLYVNAFYANLTLALTTIALLALARVSLGRIKWVLSLVAGILPFIGVGNSLFQNKPGDVMFTWHFLIWQNTVTTSDIIWAFASVLSYFTIFVATMFLLLTTRDRDIAAVIRTLRLPRIFSFVVGLTFRSIGLFFDDLQTAKEALTARGVEFEKASIVERVRRNGRLGIPMMLILLRRATDIAFALDVRRFRTPGVKSTHYSKLTFRPRDLVLLTVIWGAFWAALVLWATGGVLLGIFH